MKIKDNIKGKINKNNFNYEGRFTQKDLPKLFPKEDDLDMKIAGIKQNRKRYKEFPNSLPTNNNEMPYPPDEHEMIGEYEYKHNLYLIFAHAYNKAMERIKILEQEIQQYYGKS